MKRNILIIGALVLSGILGCSKGCKKEEAPTPTTGATDTSKAASGLVAADIKVGDGVMAESGKTVTVHYTGTLTDGTKFDSSYDIDRPFTFVLGKHNVIEGWEQGLIGMKIGGKRKLTIPPDLAYGERGAGNLIPPNSTLIFDVELLKVE